MIISTHHIHPHDGLHHIEKKRKQTEHQSIRRVTGQHNSQITLRSSNILTVAVPWQTCFEQVPNSLFVLQ